MDISTAINMRVYGHGCCARASSASSIRLRGQPAQHSSESDRVSGWAMLDRVAESAMLDRVAESAMLDRVAESANGAAAAMLMHTRMLAATLLWLHRCSRNRNNTNESA
jgi:hypothetical protein